MYSYNLYIETNRLLIRPFNLEDIESAYLMNLDPEVSKYTGDGGIVSKKEIERRIVEDVICDYKKYGFGRLAVELKYDKKFIGFTGLKYLEDMKAVDLGFRFMKAYWGRGIATEAGKACLNHGFETIGLKKIIAIVLPKNVNSIRVLEKLHFDYERDIIEDDQIAKLYAIRKNKHVNL